MKLEVGTLAEIGAKVGDVVEEAGGLGVTFELMDDCKLLVRYADGHERTLERGWYWDNGIFRIISRAETAPTGPVITETVTRKRIVPGVYGKVIVHELRGEDGEIHIALLNNQCDKERIIHACMTRSDLIAARDVFNHLIDALEE